jgi:transposase
MTKRRSFSADRKAKVALEAIKGQRTVSEIAARYQIHPNLVTQWKKALLEHATDAFADARAKDRAGDEQLKAELYQQIGQLKVELDWVKKIRTRPLRSSAHGSSHHTRRSRSPASARSWAWGDRATTTSREASARRTFC